MPWNYRINSMGQLCAGCNIRKVSSKVWKQFFVAACDQLNFPDAFHNDHHYSLYLEKQQIYSLFMPRYAVGEHPLHFANSSEK